MDNSFRFLGVIEPEPRSGRWIWPFTTMEVGDYFLVRHSQREPEGLRRMVYVRGTNLMKRFGFMKNDPDNPGMMRVWRKPNWEMPKLREDFDYQGLRALLREQYALDADALPWGACLKPGDSLSMPAKRRAKDQRIAVRVTVAGAPYIVELHDGFVAIERIEEGRTLDDWRNAQIEAVMS